MFKALFVTNQQIRHHHSTLNRQIISQTNDQIEYSPQKSPGKNGESTEKSSIKKQECGEKGQRHTIKVNIKDKLNLEEKPTYDKLNNLIKINKFNGRFKLFHQYQLQKLQYNFNQMIPQKKKLQLAGLSQFKTNILCVLNISEKYFDNIFEKIFQAVDEIQSIDIFLEQNKTTSLHTQIQKTHTMVIYFKNSLMSQQFHQIFLGDSLVLPIYLKEIIILQRNQQQELTYENILNCFRHSEAPSEKIIPLDKKQNELFQKKWIQLPKCPQCLLKLEFQVCGIDQAILIELVNNKSTSIQCPTCLILDQHRKQVGVHRKMSYEEGYNKPQKHAHCDDCKQKTDIWICMVCSRIGCGRYKNADAYKHFVNSGHTITIDLETERVWNYLSDCFSHKILKNVSQPTSSVKFPSVNRQQNEKVQQSTLQAAFWQYCSVFSEQMQRQRIFYESIRKSQQQKFQIQVQTLQKITKQLQKQLQQKSMHLKKLYKQKSKCNKKQKQIQKKVQQQRLTLKQYEDCLQINLMQDFLQKDEDIIRKRQQIEQLNKQLNQILIQLSN